MASEKFCLRWNDFESNISTAFRELRDDKDFFDVTLACDDEQIQAHKVILSACSPFFRTVLRRNPHAHPLLYLKGVKFSDLQSVLNFMYHGEVNVAQEELNSFLAVAEELRVKGLTQNNQGGSSSSSTKKDSFSTAPRPQAAAPRIPDPVPPPKKPRPAAAPSYSGHDDDDIQEVMPTVKTEPLPAAAVASEPYQQQEQSGQLQQVDDGMGYDEEGYEDYGQYGAEGGYEGTLVDADGNKGDKQLYDYIEKAPECGPRGHRCTLCGKTGNDRGNLRKHIENVHFPGTFSYQCRHCPTPAAIFPTRTKLNNHMSAMHKILPF